MQFKIELSPEQCGSFARILNNQFNRIFNRLTFENYCEYYNIRQVLKKCFDKIYQLDKKPVKKIRLSFCHNEARAIKMVFSIEDFTLLPPYELVAVSDILGQINKREINDLQKTPLNQSNLSFRTNHPDFGAKVPEIEKELYNLA